MCMTWISRLLSVQNLWFNAIRDKTLESNPTRMGMPSWSGHGVFLTLQERVTMDSIVCSMCRSLEAKSVSSFPSSTTTFTMLPGLPLVINSLWSLALSQLLPLCMTVMPTLFSNSVRDSEILSECVHFLKLLWLEDLAVLMVRWTSGNSKRWSRLAKPSLNVRWGSHGPQTDSTSWRASSMSWSRWTMQSVCSLVLARRPHPEVSTSISSLSHSGSQDLMAFIRSLTWLSSKERQLQSRQRNQRRRSACQVAIMMHSPRWWDSKWEVQAIQVQGS